MLRLLPMLIAFYLAGPLFSLTSINYPQEDTTVDFFTFQGLPFIELEVLHQDGEVENGLFLIDTGSDGSFWFDRGERYTNNFTSKDYIAPQETRVQSARHNKFSINGWVLRHMWTSRPEIIKIDNNEYRLLGILGSDILFSRSFYFSMTEKKMGWPSIVPFTATNTYKVKPITLSDRYVPKNRIGTTIALPADYRLTGHTPYWNEGQDGYLFDTGIFEIATSLSNFKMQTGKFPTAPFYTTLRTDLQITTGFIVVPEFVLGGEPYRNVFFSGGHIPVPFVTSLGTQITSRFNWYFEIPNEYNPEKNFSFGKAFAQLVPEADYIEFMNGINLGFHFIFPESIGFTVDESHKVDRIMFKGNEPILKYVSIGDLIISFNGVSLENSSSLELIEGRYGFRKPSGEEYFVDAIKTYLEGIPR